MNKIRVIDLLNKIANGEEVPTYIKVKDSIFGVSCKFNGHDLDYQLDTLDNEEYYLSDYICKGGLSLNDEIEIIEEDKKIEKIDVNYLQQIKKWKRAKVLGNKINEIIDKINKMEDK